MVTEDQAMEIAKRFVRSRTGRDCPILDVRQVTGDAIDCASGRQYWMVSLELEPGLDPSLLVRVDARTGEAVQEEVL